MKVPDTLYRDSLQHGYLRVERDDPHHTAILANLLRTFNLGPGDRVLEIGAGFGRYTRLLRDFGLFVKASEPDAKMLAHLEQRFAGDPLVTCSALAAEELVDDQENTDAICGFHVLHHLAPAALAALAAAVRTRCRHQPGFRGWFFIEPNNLNPLYVAQIGLTAGMRFHEERGIWTTDYQRYLGEASREPVCLGRVGLFPPRALFLRLPKRIARWQTTLKPRTTPWSLYRVIGAECKPAASSAAVTTRR